MTAPAEPSAPAATVEADDAQVVAKVRFKDLFGCMRGMIRIMPGVDVTAPAYSEAEWAEIEAERAAQSDAAPRKATSRR